jgi:hypothetical protein
VRGAAASTQTDESQAFTVRPDAAGCWASLRDVGVMQYVKSGDGYVAFQVLSKGSADILVVNESVLPIEALLDNVHTASYLARLAEWGRVIVFDRQVVGHERRTPCSGHCSIVRVIWVPITHESRLSSAAVHC